MGKIEMGQIRKSLLILIIALVSLTSCNGITSESSNGSFTDYVNTILGTFNIPLDSVKISTSDEVGGIDSLTIVMGREFDKLSDFDKFSLMSQLFDLRENSLEYKTTDGVLIKTPQFDYLLYFDRSNADYEIRVNQSGRDYLVAGIDSDYLALLKLALNNDLLTKVADPDATGTTLDKTSDVYKLEIYEFIESRYKYYDEVEGQYSGDKYTRTIFEEAATKYGVTYDFVDSVWSNSSIAAKAAENYSPVIESFSTEHPIPCATSVENYLKLVNLIQENNEEAILNGYRSGIFFNVQANDKVKEDRYISEENIRTYMILDGVNAKKYCYTTNWMQP